MLKFKDQYSYYMSGFSEEKDFPSGGTIVKLSLPIEELEIAIKQMKEAGKNLVKLEISKRKEASVSKTDGKILSTHTVVYNCHPVEAANEDGEVSAPRQGAPVAASSSSDSLPF